MASRVSPSSSVIIEQPEAKLQFLAGIDWQPIDSIEKDDIADLVERRREDKQPKASYSSVCQTQLGTYAIGFIHKAAGRVKKNKCFALAVVCSNFAQAKRINDAVFVFATNDKKILIAIKNGLPFFDAVFADDAAGKDEFDTSVNALLPNFDTGCTIYGDESLLPPPVAALNMSQLTGNRHLFETGQIVPMTSIVPVVVAVAAAVIAGVIAFNYYSDSVARDAAMKAAQKEALSQTAAVETPAQKLEKKRREYVLSRGDCSKKGMLDGYKTATEMLENYGGFSIDSVTINCATGAAIATLSAKSVGEPDLFIYKKDPQLKIDANIIDAHLSHDFNADKIVDIDPSQLSVWPEFLAKNGTELRSFGDLGIKFKLSAPSSIYAVGDSADKPILSGGATIAGNAVYLLPMINRIDDVHWKSFGITRLNGNGPDAQSDFQFQLFGDFYVTQ